MREILLIAAAVLFHFLLFFTVGSCALSLCKIDTGITDALVTGYFGYFALFEVISLFCVFTGCSQRVFSLIVLAAAAVSAAVCACRKDTRSMIARSVGNIVPNLREHSFWLVVLIVIVLCECVAEALYVDMSQDSLQYVGTASTAVYTNTLFRYDPFTGDAYKRFPIRYVFFCYPLHASVVAVWFHLNAVITSRIVMPVVSCIMASFVWLRTAATLFQKRSKKTAELMVLLIHVLMFMQNTNYLPATFFFARLYEGKALLANLSSAMAFLCGLLIWRGEEGRFSRLLLALSTLASVCFSGSSYILLLSFAAFALIGLLRRRNLKEMLKTGLCFVPAGCVWILYILMRVGILSRAIP
ncbi:MAG: hypothetical protein IJI24_09435 [Lachnospiraceae bacterium]|nr:hypothetical protein [Lachnospiraceae bacterium]